jgi:hypothetical protein
MSVSSRPHSVAFASRSVSRKAEADVFRRFERSLVNLAAVLPDADESFLYDNSTAEGITLVARFSAGTLVECAPDVPRWLVRALGRVPPAARAKPEREGFA